MQGVGINNLTVSGNLCVAQSLEEVHKKFQNGDILVVKNTDNTILNVLKNAKGIIVEEEGTASHAAIVGMTLDIPVVTGAKNATKILKSGTTVTIDGRRGLVYEGVTKVL